VVEATLISQPKAELYIYEDSLSQFNLIWKINFVANSPIGDWEVLVDANSGTILKVTDISFHSVNGHGKVFKPDPITSLQNSSLTDQNDTDYVELQNAYSIETLNNLNDPVGGLYSLQGIYARSEEIESPTMILATSNTDSFMYNRSQPGFEETNAYYFIDMERQYIGSLGFTPKWNGYDYIRFDAHGVNGDNNSHYSPSLKYLAYGDGGVDAGEDQDVIIHEYTHALHDVLMPGGLGSYVSNEGAVSEGSGDYLALSLRRTLSSFLPNHFSNWDLNASGRDLSPNLYFFSAWQDRGGTMWEPHRAGRLWSSTMMDIESSVGRDVATTLLLTSFSYVSYSSPVQDHVHAILQADRDVYNGSHLAALVSVFYQRGFFYNMYISGTIIMLQEEKEFHKFT